ncbi:MAG: hypothetical protein GF311_16480 [Candidatus Lokiarchaeota archaeon]|nr:hypothetical protein [Candidatus Lokiarchaeota archaeon]
MHPDFWVKDPQFVYSCASKQVREQYPNLLDQKLVEEYKNGNTELIFRKFDLTLPIWSNEPFTPYFHSDENYQYNHYKDQVFVRLPYTNFPWVPLESFRSNDKVLEDIFFDMAGILDFDEWTHELYSKLKEEGAQSSGRHFILAAKKATELIPDDPNNWWNYGTALELYGKKEQAKEMYKKAAELTPNNYVIRKILGEQFKGLKEGDVEVLKEIESITGKEFIEVNKIRNNTKMGFTTKNEEITGISLYNMELSELTDSIGEFESLETLNLAYNKLTTLPKTIENLESLKILDLSKNSLKVLPESLFRLNTLESLNLRNNKISLVPEFIEKLVRLKELNLSLNRIVSLPDNIGNLLSLEVLKLGNNNLSTLPESIRKLQSLQLLSLKSNEISEFPDLITDLKSLLKLFLESNKINKLPDSIRNLKSLEELYLNKNQVKKLPETIKELSSLKILNLYDNEISDLPLAIIKVPHLKKLNLSKNNLPPKINKIYNQKTLELTRGFINDPKETFNKLSKLINTLGSSNKKPNEQNLIKFKGVKIIENEVNVLKEFEKLLGGDLRVYEKEEIDDIISIDMEYLSIKIKINSVIFLDLHSANSIKTLPDSLGKLSSLETLLLSGNNIKTIPKSIENLESLKILDLSHNNLKVLPESIINLKSLKTLFLNGNNLSTLPESIGYLPSLKRLSLALNNLKILPDSFLSNCFKLNLKHLYIGGNPLDTKLFGNTPTKKILKTLKKYGVKIYKK